jgi:protein disulfide-isomerase A6
MPNLFENLKGVIELKPEDFIRLPDNSVSIRGVGNDEVGFVIFYADWCGHCRNSVPNIKRLGELVVDQVFIGAFNCANKSNQNYDKVAKAVGVKYFPTIKFLNKGKLHPYNGNRKVIDFLKFLCERTSQFCEY